MTGSQQLHAQEVMSSDAAASVHARVFRPSSVLKHILKNASKYMAEPGLLVERRTHDWEVATREYESHHSAVDYGHGQAAYA